MKHPIQNDDNGHPTITQEDLMNAENRAIESQQEASDLRKKLEGLEALLAKTKETLASTNSKIEQKDQEILKVQGQAKMLGQSVKGLEERFERLKVLQNQLNEKRVELELKDNIKQDTPETEEDKKEQI